MKNTLFLTAGLLIALMAVVGCVQRQAVPGIIQASKTSIPGCRQRCAEPQGHHPCSGKS